MAALIVNKKGRRKTTKRRAPKRAVARRRNPVSRKKKGIVEETLMPAVVAGSGAVIGNMIFDYGTKQFDLPAEWQTGYMRYAVEGAAFVGMGMALNTNFGKKLIKDKKTRDNLVQGALTLTLYRAMDSAVVQSGVMADVGLEGYQSLRGYQSLNGMGYQNTGGQVMPFRR